MNIYPDGHPWQPVNGSEKVKKSPSVLRGLQSE